MTPRDVLDHIPLPIMIVQDRRVAYVNALFLALLGQHDTQPPIDHTRHVRIGTTGEASVLEPIARRCEALASGDVIHAHLMRFDGRTVPAELTVRHLDWEGAHAIQICARDLTSEYALQTKFDSLASGSIEGILVHRNMKPLFVNDAYARMYGFESPDDILRMESILRLTDPDDQRTVLSHYKRRMKGKTAPRHYMHRSRTREGNQIYVDNLVTIVEWDGEPAVQVTNLDVTRYVGQAESGQGERMDVLSQIAEGMAHRFIDDVTIVSGEIQRARSYFYSHGLGEAMMHLDRMEKAASRMIQELESLLMTGRQGVPVSQKLEVNDLVADVMRRALDSDSVIPFRRGAIRYAVETDPTHPAVNGDPLYLRLVLRNLLENARDALPHGGMISVVVQTTSGIAWSGGEPGTYVEIDVVDDGIGMPRNMLDRIGEPFITTKEGHAGLGLYTARAVAAQHNGRIEFRHRPPTGSVVTLFLPRVN